ncbi:MAG: hypothetical protein PHS53_05085 [Candidatus Pacebacteria bacterium]|nr:hypothetical protein [Candidatus Paceibacterota bacterium]
MGKKDVPPTPFFLKVGPPRENMGLLLKERRPGIYEIITEHATSEVRATSKLCHAVLLGFLAGRLMESSRVTLLKKVVWKRAPKSGRSYTAVTLTFERRVVISPKRNEIRAPSLRMIQKAFRNLDFLVQPLFYS